MADKKKLIYVDDLIESINGYRLGKIPKGELLWKIEQLPAVEAAPVVHGRWIVQDDGRTRFMCSICGSKNYQQHYNYCPNCGAKMDLEKFYEIKISKM